MSRKPKPRKVAIVGNQSFPLTVEIGRQIVDLIRELGPNVVIFTRGSEGLDDFVYRACGIMEIECVLCPSAGGKFNWLRDAEMSRECDELLAFLDPKTLHDENTGTSHLVSKFLDKRRRVRAFSASGDRLVYVGETE